MRAVTIYRTGPADVLELRDVPPPAPEPDQVLVDVAFCGCNWADTQVRAGVYAHAMSYPMVLGFEISGTVSAVGDRVEGIAVGDRVAAIVGRGGGYAEQVAVDARDIIPLPATIPLDVAAAFPIQALTAYHMLHTIYRVKAGDAVLCHAIGGGVGLHVAQLGRRAGARILGTVGTPGKEALPLAYGAERVVNHRSEDFVTAAMDFTAGKGLDLAIDSLGATTLDRTYDAMRNLGHVINIGEAEGEPFTNIRERILPRSLTFTRFHLQHVDPHSTMWRQGYETVLAGIADGTLHVPIVERFDLSEAPEMHRRIEGRGVSGKLLLATGRG
jgi:NADPH2:quinone reductase